MVSLVARSGRQLQRYSDNGRRLVVGCIPYRLIAEKPGEHCLDKALEVLVISPQKGQGICFPKGGWEKDELIREAVSREALEEAGVQGKVQKKLGTWSYKSKSSDIFHEGHIYSLLVTEQLDLWPEKQTRKRQWVSVVEARENCIYPWMKEALDELVNWLSKASRRNTFCSYTL